MERKKGKMKITVIGTGFVGVVTAAVFSSFGNEVVGLDIDDNKVEQLKNSKVPFYEPKLEELLRTQQKTGKLSFTTDYQTAIKSSELVILAVGTPSNAEGGADLTYLLTATKELAPYLKSDAIIAVKSTVPPGTLSKVEKILSQNTKVKYHLAALPEFLKEGSAVDDTLHPDRVVVGASDPETFTKLRELHQPLSAPIVEVSPESAQMAKYAANAYLATRITFINQIADLCEKNGADVEEVISAIGKDKRIGEHYWYPGVGYGGSCFPKDVKELAYYSRQVGEGENLFNKVAELNQQRIHKLMEEFAQHFGGWSQKRVAILGLAFKPHTDDMREAPSLKMIPYLLEHNAEVTAYDPKARQVAQSLLSSSPKLQFVDSISAACQEADVIVALIEWPEIIEFDYSQVAQPEKEQWLIDARNKLSPSEVKKWGFSYIGIGRGSLDE